MIWQVSMISGTLGTLFNDGLQYLYDAHQQGAEQAAANVKTSTSPRLRALLRSGTKRNLVQARRLERVFKLAGLAPHGRHDLGMEGIAKANQAMVGQMPDGAGRDLLNIAAGQAAAHLFLANYGTLRSYARLLGNRKAARLLRRTQNETSAIDQRLTKLARRLSKRSGSPGYGRAGAIPTVAVHPGASLAAMAGGSGVAALAARYWNGRTG